MRRAIPCLASLALLLFATSAQASGVNLTWVRCYGDGGVPNRAFACNANAGTNLLVGSFAFDSTLRMVQGLSLIHI